MKGVGPFLARSVLVGALAAGVPLAGGCKKQPAPVEAPKVRIDRYTVRGEVSSLPSPSDPASEFMVRHEAMPHFRQQGGALGMNTMTMGFPVAPGVSLDALRVGDKIELTFEVEFDAASDALKSYRATVVRVLPAETVLDFTPLAPASKPSAPAGESAAPKAD